MAVSRNSKLLALGIVAIVVAALVTRVFLTMPDHGGSFGQAIWSMYRFFTVLTNTLVGLILAAHVLGRPQSASRLAGITLAISIVGVVYHLLLAHLVDFSGLALVVDHAFHTVVPGLTFLWWLIYATKAPLGVIAPLTWLIWPAVYCVYAISRGLLDGEYPYPFLNLTELGWGGLAQSVLGFLIAFAIAGYLMWGVAKLLARFQSAKPG